jgi:ketosteroid isomerase-like protein
MTYVMERRTFLVAITASVPAALATSTAERDSQAIVRLMSGFVEAERGYDKAAVSRVLDDAFIYVGNDGSLTNRADFIRLTDKVVNPLDVLDVTDIEVHVRGDTAIATGLIHERGTIDGRGYEFTGRTLTIFSRQNGRWMCVAIHD